MLSYNFIDHLICTKPTNLSLIEIALFTDVKTTTELLEAVTMHHRDFRLSYEYFFIDGLIVSLKECLYYVENELSMDLLSKFNLNVTDSHRAFSRFRGPKMDCKFSDINPLLDLLKIADSPELKLIIGPRFKINVSDAIITLPISAESLKKVLIINETRLNNLRLLKGED